MGREPLASGREGTVDRNLRTRSTFEGEHVRFWGELRDTWCSDDGAITEDIHWYEVEVITTFPDLVITDITARPRHLPSPECPGAVHALQDLVGASLARGFRRRLDEALRGTAGCTHLHTLLYTIWTSQVILRYTMVRPDMVSGAPRDASVLDRVVDSCYGWRADGQIAADTRAGRPYSPHWHEGDPVPVDPPTRRSPG